VEDGPLSPAGNEQADYGALRQETHSDARLLALAAEIVAGYLRRNPVASDVLPGVIKDVHAALYDLSGLAPPGLNQVPAVAPERSVTREYIVCLEDGKRLKMLKRHLRSKFGLTPDQYRKKWNLPASYPMVAPGYAATRSRLAHDIGLGNRPSSPKIKKKKS
jgi:MucR family transcriptional regulator, transcriptional regulator of exopolysaccharide biosynthesis